MAVFRIEKTRDYTVMANHHLRNTALSLKAKGLLSLMLSLPEDWDYTTKGCRRIGTTPPKALPGYAGMEWTAFVLRFGSWKMRGILSVKESVTPTGGSAASSTRSWSSPGHRNLNRENLNGKIQFR